MVPDNFTLAILAGQSRSASVVEIVVACAAVSSWAYLVGYEVSEWRRRRRERTASLPEPRPAPGRTCEVCGAPLETAGELAAGLCLPCFREGRSGLQALER